MWRCWRKICLFILLSTRSNSEGAIHVVELFIIIIVTMEIITKHIIGAKTIQRYKWHKFKTSSQTLATFHLCSSLRLITCASISKFLLVRVLALGHLGQNHTLNLLETCMQHNHAVRSPTVKSTDWIYFIHRVKGLK